MLPGGGQGQIHLPGLKFSVFLCTYLQHGRKGHAGRQQQRLGSLIDLDDLIRLHQKTGLGDLFQHQTYHLFFFHTAPPDMC